MELVSVYVLVSVLVSASVQMTPYCDSFNEMTTYAGLQSDIPSLPEIPDSFQTNVEVNMMEYNSTMDVQEYFDNLGNRAALITISNGIEGRAIFDYETNQLFYITNGICMVSTLSNSMYSDLFGVEDSDGYKHIMSSNTALKFGQKYGEKYMGKDVIRGINVNHWQACLQWSRENANFTVDYYFTDPHIWETSSDFVTVPVRADVQGITKSPDGWKNFHHVYDYYAFKPFAGGDGLMFETPAGVICPGRQKGQPVPTLPNQFYYRQEMVSPADGYMTFADVWYDEAYRLVRIDYRPLSPGPPFYNVNPLTQIDDFNGGVRYLKDRILGNCTILSLDNSTFGAQENQTLKHNNGSFELQMKHPLQLFDLNKNFIYVGQRPCRDMTCNVFSAIVTNFYVEGEVLPINATIEVFFLSNGMYDIPNHGPNYAETIPVRLTVSSEMVDFYRVYNIMDFDSSHPDLSSFDISSCYPNTAKMHFNVRFPASFRQDTADVFKLQSRLLLAEVMAVSPLRIQNVFLDYDIGDVFLYATLIDRTPATVQFTYITGHEIEKMDDMVLPNTQSPMECATYCVDLTNITCNSFDFCPNPGQQTATCRLSRSHVGDGTAVLIQSPCSHYSRNVNGPRLPEKTILEAYAALRFAVYNSKFSFKIQEDNHQIIEYEAVDTSVQLGMVQPVPMPKLSGQFSYSQEITLPSYAQVYNSKVWYDSDYKMVRYDFHQSEPTAPFYSTNPMTFIHDYNSGVSYTIDRFYDNCTIAPISSRAIDSELDEAAKMKNGAYVVQMRSPLEMFHISNNYRFVGQKTVRGQLCSGYESLVENFTIPGLQGVNEALIRYFFLQNGWEQIADDGGDLTLAQPVRMEVTIIQQGLFFVYDFYDFEERHPDLSVFDIRKCFTEANQHHFQIKFPGQFHPFLDIYRKIFQVKAQMAMAQYSGASVLRFQDTQIDYDDDYIYVTSTLLGRNPFLAGYTQLPGSVSPHQSDAHIPNIKTAVACADICSSISSFRCNSFDFCPTAGYCFLNKNHIQDGPKVNMSTACFHFSKTVSTSTVPSPSMKIAFINLKNAVYQGKFNISIPHGEMVELYSATSIRDDIIRPSGTPQFGRILNRFQQMKNRILSGNGEGQEKGVAVDDCAASCLLDDQFDCQAFSYCYNTGICTLSVNHPEENLQLIKSSSACDVFSRQYLDNYDELPGKVYKMKATEELSASSANLCAKQCTLSPMCKSFDYCSNTKSCLLRSNHTLDTPASFLTPSPQCNHYSRKYLFDFKKGTGKEMTFGPSLIFNGVSVEQCAKSCVEEESLYCHSFDYCSNTSTCTITSTKPQTAQGIVLRDYCDIYSRVFYPGGRPRVYHPTSSPNDSNNTNVCSRTSADSSGDSSASGTSSGAVVGVAFGVFILGLVLGALAVILYRKHLDKKNDEMGVSFVRDSHELS